ncbi:MAG: ABC transporter ATP-binding protein [Armatimonadetes bacterium CG2_30_59_28]|nr:MAG: ABC transporter ATP-binding protein [Armatimonadetes bacterium CG2_30_59_28]PIU60571.1 MAG: ABC transporter ATP-binding protein [Armatimonadetes bacterium CG07_land_8_20_14_0_80_59_28]PIX39254.1 MAG: ABC transporter ATP-binding protein [Armatimonadetes bacterium CG_4_8_14_3_um_filter_58_9]PJB77947.1 MAG: ABC transporter ATP-binding protein [Armatimonadetes bacterium CG_4_9_14_3_um_filter_58_7]
MLVVESIDVYYGVIRALTEVSLNVKESEIVTLIGSNGAGKSTTLLTVSGLRIPRKGSIRFLGEDITRLPPHKRVEHRIVQVPEGRRIFPDMTVQENLDMGAFSRPRGAIHQELEMVFHLFPILQERKKQLAGTLSGGEQQMLAIGRALMAKPLVLLLDEPSLGLSPILVQDIFRTIVQIRQQGVTVLLVEQNALQALRIADRGYVLETGRVVLSGKASDLLNNAEVRNTYLGA